MTGPSEEELRVYREESARRAEAEHRRRVECGYVKASISSPYEWEREIAMERERPIREARELEQREARAAEAEKHRAWQAELAQQRDRDAEIERRAEAQLDRMRSLIPLARRERAEAARQDQAARLEAIRNWEAGARGENPPGSLLGEDDMRKQK